MKYISLHVDYLPVNMKNAAILEMAAPAVCRRIFHAASDLFSTEACLGVRKTVFLNVNNQ